MEYIGVSALQGLAPGKFERAIGRLLSGHTRLISTMTKMIEIEDICRRCIKTNLAIDIPTEHIEEFELLEKGLSPEMRDWRTFWERG